MDIAFLRNREKYEQHLCFLTYIKTTVVDHMLVCGKTVCYRIRDFSLSISQPLHSSFNKYLFFCIKIISQKKYSIAPLPLKIYLLSHKYDCNFFSIVRNKKEAEQDI